MWKHSGRVYLVVWDVHLERHENRFLWTKPHNNNNNVHIAHHTILILAHTHTSINIGSWAPEMTFMGKVKCVCICYATIYNMNIYVYSRIEWQHRWCKTAIGNDGECVVMRNVCTKDESGNPAKTKFIFRKQNQGLPRSNVRNLWTANQ